MHSVHDASVGPFGDAPAHEVFFPGAGRENVCQSLILDILNGKRFLHLGGEAGSGKTHICQAIMARLPGNITPVYLDAPGGSFDELMRHVCVNLGAGKSDGTEGFTWAGEFDRQLSALGEDNRVLLIIDQAERVFAATLERLLARVRKGDSPSFVILLAGSDGLDAPLAQLTTLGPDYTPDSSHILPPLDQDETEKYLRCRLHAAGIGWNGHDAILGKKRVARICRQAQGNIARINAAAVEILEMPVVAVPEKGETPERRLPLRTEAGAKGRAVPEAAPPRTEPEMRRSEPVSADVVAEPATVVVETAEFAMPEEKPVEVSESVDTIDDLREAAPEAAAAATEAEVGRSEAVEQAATTAAIAESGNGAAEPARPAPPERDGRSVGFRDGIAKKTLRKRKKTRPGRSALEKLVASPIIALYDRLWGDRRILGGVLALALLFCILGLSLGTEDRPEAPSPTATSGDVQPPDAENRPVPTPAVAHSSPPDGPTLLNDRLAAGKVLVAASYRGAVTIQVLTVSGDKAERELAELLGTRPFQQAADQLYVVRKPGAPPAFFVFYGIFDDEEQARQARNSMDFELRAHHPYPLPVSEALRLNEN